MNWNSFLQKVQKKLTIKTNLLQINQRIKATYIFIKCKHNGNYSTGCILKSADQKKNLNFVNETEEDSNIDLRIVKLESFKFKAILIQEQVVQL